MVFKMKICFQERKNRGEIVFRYSDRLSKNQTSLRIRLGRLDAIPYLSMNDPGPLFPEKNVLRPKILR